MRAQISFGNAAADWAQLMIRDVERTRSAIIEVATKEFSLRGYSGGRVNEIGKRTRTSKRMIYYYFGSKEALYRAVLAGYYRRLHRAHSSADLMQMDPLQGLVSLTRSTFDWHLHFASEVPLVMYENIHSGIHIGSLSTSENLRSTAIDVVEDIYHRGVADGSMRPNLRPIDIYNAIVSASFFNVSNRYTFRAIFGHDMSSPEEIELRRESLIDSVTRYVAANSRCQTSPPNH